MLLVRGSAAAPAMAARTGLSPVVSGVRDATRGLARRQQHETPRHRDYLAGAVLGAVRDQCGVAGKDRPAGVDLHEPDMRNPEQIADDLRAPRHRVEVAHRPSLTAPAVPQMHDRDDYHDHRNDAREVGLGSAVVGRALVTGHCAALANARNRSRLTSRQHEVFIFTQPPRVSAGAIIPQ